ncbi:hypothetical protein GTA08_BOTSDO13885 [Neofusicoccum parvum]|uniref:Uncharacterized protein n=1 Tax=Neofusicoccum parvum TaxID=310453 RepID=A0ACB5RTZ1_9PEZI|nr:hypothetical protein GTA08_BOTSDO13885 [Neofusicoccum parvum]
MSTDSLAFLRRHTGADLADLANQHLQHDLTPSDRATLNRAAQALSTHAALGSLAGLALGALLFARVRGARARALAALRAVETPVALRFKDGRTEPLPDLGRLAAPSPWTDAAAALLFAAGGLFVGGEVGLLTGAGSARRVVGREPEARERIEKAFLRYQADVLRRRAEELEGAAAEGEGRGRGVLESARSVVGWR